MILSSKSVLHLRSKIKSQKKFNLFFKKNYGVGGATIKGFQSAFDQGYDIVINLMQMINIK